jgi:hypothetical protein
MQNIDTQTKRGERERERKWGPRSKHTAWDVSFKMDVIQDLSLGVHKTN